MGQYAILIEARNGLQHQLVSLAPDKVLDDSDETEQSRDVYECCRLTALLYSNAVVFPIPTQTGWYLWFIARLQTLHSRSDTLKKSEFISVSIWSLYISGIAALRTKSSAFFVASLREALQTAGLRSWPAVRELLSRYLWTDRACGYGGAMLWDKLDL